MELNQREEEKQRDVWMERERESRGGTSLWLLVSGRPRARLAPSGSGSSLSERSGGAVPGSDRWLRSLSLLFWVNCGVIVDAVCSGTATRGNGGEEGLKCDICPWIASVVNVGLIPAAEATALIEANGAFPPIGG